MYSPPVARVPGTVSAEVSGLSPRTMAPLCCHSKKLGYVKEAKHWNRTACPSAITAAGEMDAFEGGSMVSNRGRKYIDGNELYL